ncbi:reticulon-like protein B8 [Populus alba x Populus x berolinensis]|nr:reticulon-like protein B8 [Populus alba x Populus x berolinensis]
MPEKITAENLISNLVETIADSVPKQKSVSFFEEGEESVTSRINRLFGRQKPVHHLLGGGKSADVLLWRNKKISAGVLTGATAIWVLFEWLNYHLLSLICFALALGLHLRSLALYYLMIYFVSIGRSIGAEVNRSLLFLQDLSCGGNLKQFLALFRNYPLDFKFKENFIWLLVCCKMNGCQELIFHFIHLEVKSSSISRKVWEYSHCECPSEQQDIQYLKAGGDLS